MKNKHLHSKRAVLPVLLILLLSVAGMTKAQTGNITFADANVKAICVTNWDTDGDGELNQTEAAVVTTLDGVFMFDDEITTFDEMRFFTGLTAIGEDEFNSCTSLTAISIPNTVTSIGNYAFSDCSSLTSITSYTFVPPTLGNNVFDNVPSAMVVNVPCGTSALYQTASGWSDLSNYEEFVFDLCPIAFADDNVKAICVTHWDTNGDGELNYAEAAAVTNLGTHFKSTNITSFDELEYFSGITSLPNTAFYGCTSLASITLPSSVSALGNGSFYNCTNLATMTVYAETPPTVGTNAFKNVPTTMVVHVPCGAYEAYHNANDWNVFSLFDPCLITFADAKVKALCVANWDTNGDGELSYAEAAVVTYLGLVFWNKSNITTFDELQYFVGLTSIGSDAFYSCSGLTSIVIPNSVTSIGFSAFENCSGLTAIEIPNSVTSIGSYAFFGCSGLTAIEIPNSVTSIGSSAFYNCSGLTSVEIPNSVTSIGSSAFSGCSGLTQIVVASGNTVYDSRDNCNAIIKTATNQLITGCKNAVIPNSVTSIGSYAFSGCSGLTSIEIPNSVTSIGYSAFENCSGLTAIEIPNSVTSIGYSAFENCSGLTAIEIPNSVTSIGSSAFSGCSGLTQIVVANGNTVYDSRDNCNAIIKTATNQLITGCKNTVIPNSVTSIGDWAFYSCSGLTAIEIPNSVTSIGSSAFSGCSGLTQIVVANGNTVYDSRGNCNAIIKTATNQLITGCKNTVIPNSVTSIGDRAFYSCSGLTSIEIPNSVTSIGSFTFSDCSNLASIEISNSVTSIGDRAFYNCSGLTSMTVLADNPPALYNDK